MSTAPGRVGRVLLVSLHTSPTDQPGSGNAGGMNTYVLQTALALAARGVGVEIVTGAGSGDRVVEVADRVRLRVVATGSGTVGDAGADDEVDAAVRFGDLVAGEVEPCDVVHGHYWRSGIAGRRVATGWGAAFVQSAHTLAAVKRTALAAGQRAAGSSPDGPGDPPVRETVERDLARVADRLVANTAGEAAELVRFCGADPARVAVVEPGVDTSVFSPVGPVGERARTLTGPGLDPADPAVAYVGRLQPLKGPDVLVRAAGPLLDVLAAAGRPRRLSVLVVGAPAAGAGDTPRRLAALAAELPDGVSVRFLDPRPAPVLAAIYRSVDLVAVPSRSESFGLVALEAQACGTPVVAARVGGLPRAVAPRPGALVDGHDPLDWARALGALLTDPAAHRAAADAARRHAEFFSWDRTAAGLLDVYGAALNSHLRSGGMDGRGRAT